MKNIFFKTIQTGVAAMALLAGNLQAQYPGAYSGTYRNEAPRYESGYREARVAPWEVRLAERRHFLWERKREIERELRSGWVRGYRRAELIRQDYRIREELEHMPAGPGYRRY